MLQLSAQYTAIKKNRIECHCDIDNHYIGYVECMTGWCKHWSRNKEYRGKDL